jgi:peptidoglycan/xylan/chitin deacetylase (PgdA/CDA1 family)
MPAAARAAPRGLVMALGTAVPLALTLPPTHPLAQPRPHAVLTAPAARTTGPSASAARRAPALSHPKSPLARPLPVGCRAAGPLEARFEGTRGAVRKREVALSFDDGPWSDTRAFVRMLHAHHVVATFFMIGEQINPSYRSVLREELRDGDALGDHTWTHPDLVYSHEVASQLRGTREVIRRETGYTPCVFRPPYGAYNSSIVGTARSLGLATVMWNVDPMDWALPGTSAIIERVLAQVRPGSIILSHDGGGPRGETLAAYPRIIAALRERGYRFVTVPRLLGFRTIYRHAACGHTGPGRTRPRAGRPRCR